MRGQEIRSDRCPLTVYIGARGNLEDSRFHGRYRVSERTLIGDLEGGCKEAGPTSTVTLVPSDRTTLGTVTRIMDLVKQHAPPGTPVAIQKK